MLFPFVAPADLDEATFATLRRLFADALVFEFRLTRTAWFDDRMLWLSPDPAAPFQRLTSLVSEAFPAYPPYGGQFAEVVPHLTVGDRGTAQELMAAGRAVQPKLPINAAARGVSVMVERADGWWERLISFPLTGSR